MLLLSVSLCLHSQQGSADLQKRVDELMTRVKNLENENELLKTAGRSYDSVAYMAIRAEIFEAYTNIPRLDFDFRNTSDKIAVTGLFTKLMQANNPTSDILGFRFSEIIFSATEKHFKEALKDERDKKRLSQVVSKIIDNPVISSLANTNPVTSVVAAIINTISGFTTAKAELEKEGGRVKNVSIDQRDVIDNKSITAFRNELQVYIDFYDALIVASAKYLEGIENLNAKYAYLVLSVKDYKAELLAGLDVKESNLLIKLSKLLPDPALDGINYNAIMYDPKLQRIRQLAGKYPVLYENVNHFKREYNILLINFLSDYTKTLNTALNFPESDIDKNKTEALIAEIVTFINDQKTQEKQDQNTPE
jgi:hypothetical protein